MLIGFVCPLPLYRHRLSATDVKQRVSSTVHIPSDLKEVLFNADLDFDLFDIPKPILYKITLAHDDSKESKSQTKQASGSTPVSDSKQPTEEKDKKSTDESTAEGKPANDQSEEKQVEANTDDQQMKESDD